MHIMSLEQFLGDSRHVLNIGNYNIFNEADQDYVRHYRTRKAVTSSSGGMVRGCFLEEVVPELHLKN